jgi:hypothetical protein
LTPSGISALSGSIVGLFSYNNAPTTTRVFAPSGGYVYMEALKVDSAALPGPLPIKSADASFASTAGLSASATATYNAGAALSATAGFSATGGDVANAAFTSTAGLSASAIVPVVAGASLSATAGFAADSEVSEAVFADAAFAATAGVSSGAYLDSEIAPGYLFGSVAPNPVTGG